MIKLPSLLVLVVAVGAAAQESRSISNVLPAAATKKLAESLAAAKPRAQHLWRDTPPIAKDGRINAYIEISRGDLRKWEFNIARHERAIDRMIPESIGGYPINYGIVPQTVSYDGDPFDVLVLGPPIEGGTMVSGISVGVMLMEDDHIDDAKVVITPHDAAGKPLYELTDAVKKELHDFFTRYKRHIPGASTSVPGWASRVHGLALVHQTHTFFSQCAGRSGDCLATRHK